MKLWIKFAAIAVILAAVIIAGCTSKVQAEEKEKPLYVLNEINCSSIIALQAYESVSDNSFALTAGLRDIEQRHKILFWSPTNTGYGSSKTNVNGYMVQVELDESCKK